MQRFISCIIIILITFLYTNAQETQTGSIKKHFVPWSVLEKNGKSLCPLCGEEYIPKNFGKLPSKLSLSAWHDNNLDSEYFENRIANISNLDFYQSLDSGKIPIKVMQGSEDDIYARAPQILIAQKKKEIDNSRYYGYSQFDESSFITIEEYRALMKSNTGKYNTLINNAEDVVNYNIPYGTQHFKFDGKIDFNYNFGESGKYGFHYWTWGNYLTSAYMLKGDKRFVSAFDDMFEQWYKQRNLISNTLLQYDVVWYELGIAVRLPVFIDAFRLFKNSPELRERTKDRMVRTFLGSGRWLYEALKRNPYHPYNWPVFSAISLAYLALTFPEFTESKDWLYVAKKVMDEHLAQDIYDDGGYQERTPGYSMGVFNLFYRHHSLFKYFTDDTAYCARFKPRLEKMIDFFMYTTSPLGTICPFNDSHRGSIIDFFYKFGNEFKRSDFLGSIGPFLTEDNIKNAAVQLSTPSINSINFPDSRYAVMRSGWSKDAYMMIINYGPASNHNHEDILDFEIYANGKAIAIDAGLGSKGYDDEQYRSWFRATQSHNMVMVNDSSINRGESDGENVLWASQNLTDFFSASHNGYKSLLGVVNQRQIAFVKPHYWVIFDNFSLRNERYKLDWLFHSPFTLDAYRSGFISKESPGTFLLLSEDSTKPVRKIKNKGMASLAGLPDKKEPFKDINYISFQKIARPGSPDNNFGVLVFPFTKKDTNIEFHQLKTASGLYGYEIKYNNLIDKVFFSDGKKKKFSDDLESDGQFMYLQYEGRKLKKISVVNATYCNANRKIIINEKERKNAEYVW